MIEAYVSFFQKQPIICIPVFITIIPILLSWYRKSYLDRAFLFLLIYLITKFAIDLAMFHFASFTRSNVVFYNASVPIYNAFLSAIFYYKFETTRYKRWVIWSLVLFTIFAAWDMVHSNRGVPDLNDQRVALYSGTIQSLLILFWVLLYLYETIQLLRIPNLLTFPFFWVCSGFLLYYSSLVFIASTLHYVVNWGNNLELGVVYFIPYIFETICTIFISIGIWNFSDRYAG